MDMLAQDVFEAGAGHRFLPGVEEQLWYADFASDRQPCPDRGCRFSPQWQATFFSAFTVDQNTGLRLKDHVLDSEAHQLGNPHSTSETEMKHCSVTDAVPASRGYPGSIASPRP
jgi:hypothetical protein